MRTLLISALLAVGSAQDGSVNERLEAALKQAVPDAVRRQVSNPEGSAAIGTLFSWRYDGGVVDVHYWFARSVAHAEKTLSEIASVYPSGTREVSDLGDRAFVVDGCSGRCTVHFRRGNAVVEVRAPSRLEPCTAPVASLPSSVGPCQSTRQDPPGLPPAPVSKDSESLARTGSDTAIRVAILVDGVLTSQSR
jgi:hypothetical protein